MKLGINKVISITLLVSIMFTTLVYSAFSTQLQIEGDAVIRSDQEIRITNITISNTTNGAYEEYNNKFGKDTTSMYVILPQSSSITYEVEITNKGEDSYLIESIEELSNTNSNVNIDISLNVNDVVASNSTKTFEVTMSNSTEDEQEETLVYKYGFKLNSFTIAFDKNGGSGGTSSIRASYNSSLSNISLPTRTGYAFKGYFDSEDAVELENRIEKYSNTQRINLKFLSNNWKMTNEDKESHIQGVIEVLDSANSPTIEFNDVKLSSDMYTIENDINDYYIYLDFYITNEMVADGRSAGGYLFSTYYRFLDLEYVSPSSEINIIYLSKDGKKYYDSNGVGVINYDLMEDSTLYAIWEKISDNENVTDVLEYNEDNTASNYCINGEEETCKYSTCMIDGECDTGTIIKYKVNESVQKYFYVLHDDGDTLTLQQRENTIRNIAWHEGSNDNSKGPETILPQLESATSSWTNVNEIEYTPGTTTLYSNPFTGCGYSTDTYLTSCDRNTNYGYTMATRKARARMITVLEASATGCLVWKSDDDHNYGSCPDYMHNYLYNSTNNGGSYENNTTNEGGTTDDGYWTLSANSAGNSVVWYVRYRGFLNHDATSITNYGARAVVEIERANRTKNIYTAVLTKGDNVSSIGSTTLSCTTFTGSCNITLPSITAQSGYKEIGWYNGATKVGNSGDTIELTGNINLTGKAEATNENIVVAYTYDETRKSDGTPECVNGEEETCVETNCYEQTTKNACSMGTIIKYKVNESVQKYFYVLHDDGDTLTLQQRENTVRNIAWISKEDYVAAGGLEADYGTNGNNDKGPITILNALENATSSWTNVNEIEYTLGTTPLYSNPFTGCGYSTDTYLTSCDRNTNNGYTMATRTSRARIITVLEASATGCLVWKNGAQYTNIMGNSIDAYNHGSCPDFMHNYSVNPTIYGGSYKDNTTNEAGTYNHGYWTLSANSYDSTLAWSVNHTGLLNHDDRVVNTYRGVRAVVEITK